MTQPALTAYQQAYLEETARRGIEPGHCFCGCGEDAPRTAHPLAGRGMRVGDYFRFVAGHGARKHHLEYIEEDRDYKTPCWIWQRGTSKCGSGVRYGVTRKPGTRIATQAHRAVYERHKGPIPDGLVLDHLCRVHLCVNPDHLEPVTQGVNIRRAKSSKLTEAQIVQILHMRAQGEKLRVIATLFNIHSAHASRVCSGRPSRATGRRRTRIVTERDLIKPRPNWQLKLKCSRCGGRKTAAAAFCRACWFKEIYPPREVDTEVYVVNGERCRKVLLTKGQAALVGEGKYEKVMQDEYWQAYWHPRTRSYYARCARPDPRTGKQMTVSMASVVMGTPRGTLIDHINHNTLDNRDSNLRVATPLENAWNRRKSRNNTSGYIGVTRTGNKGKPWQASIRFAGQCIHIGVYEDAATGGRAYDVKAKEYFGEFAVLNFPDED